MGENGNLSASLVDRLREDILSEKIRIGSKLSEREICEEYEVSRTPAREALRDLKNEGLLELVPNRGAFITGFTPSDMRDLFSLRNILEARCVGWAVSRITTTQLEDLEKKYEFIELYTHRGEAAKLKTLNAEFHGIIYEASQSRILIETLLLFRKYMRCSTLVKQPQIDDAKTILEEHKAIFEAFIAQDAAEAKRAMKKHIRNATLRAGL